MGVPETARLFRTPLEGTLGAAEGALLVRGDDSSVRTRGRLGGRRRAGGLGAAGGGGRRRRTPSRCSTASRTSRSADGSDSERGRRRRLVRLSRLQPRCRARARSALPAAARAAAGLRARLLRPPAAPRRRRALVVRGAVDAERAGRLAAGSSCFARGWPGRPRAAGPGGQLQPAPPRAGHNTAVEECRERIAAGEIFQANLCLRLEAEWKGDPLDLFAARPPRSSLARAAFVAGPWGAVASLSPELFLAPARPRGA